MAHIYKFRALSLPLWTVLIFFFCQPCVAYQTRNFALSATKEDPQIDLMPSSAAMAVQRALPVDMEMSGVEKDACAPGC